MLFLTYRGAVLNKNTSFLNIFNLNESNKYYPTRPTDNCVVSCPRTIITDYHLPLLLNSFQNKKVLRITNHSQLAIL